MKALSLVFRKQYSGTWITLIDDFCGLSPDQMNGVLYHPFDSADLVTIRSELPLQHCTGSRLTALLLMLITSLSDKGLPSTFQDLYALRVLRNFAVFLGLAELHFEKIDHPQSYESYNISVAATPLLDALLDFQVK